MHGLQGRARGRLQATLSINRLSSARDAAGSTTHRKKTNMQDFETIPAAGRFPLGRVVATPGAIETLEAANINSFDLLSRHHQGDWGDLSEDDKKENEFSVNKPLRIFSSYKVGDDEKVWIITEADRSATTLLLPSEY